MMEEVEKIVISVLADYIVEQVMARLNREKKKAVLLFTGSLAGFSGVPEMIETLHRQGWELQAVLSKGAETVLPIEKLRQSLPEESISATEDIRELRRLIDERPFLLLPALTVNTAAKIAYCIADEPISNAAAYGIGRGKRILACVDGCCPDRKALLPGGFHAPEAYREQMKNNLTALAGYGIWLTDIQSLPAEAERQFAAFIQNENRVDIWHNQKSVSMASAVKGCQSPPLPLTASGVTACQFPSTSSAVTDLRSIRVIGKGDVLSCSPGSRLLTTREAVITQVAFDEIRRRSIELVQG